GAAGAESDAALEIVRAAGGELGHGGLAAQRGVREARIGDLDAAESWLEQALESRTRLREHRGILITLANQAVVAALRGDHARAQELLVRARRMADEAVDGPGIGAVLQARAEFERLRGEPDKARQ